MSFLVNVLQRLPRCSGGLRELKNSPSARNSPLSCLERICLCLLDNKSDGRGRATTYEEKAPGLEAAAGRQQENEIYSKGSRLASDALLRALIKRAQLAPDSLLYYEY